MMAHTKGYMCSDESFEFVKSIEMSVRTGNVLQALDVKNFDEFHQLTKEKVLATKNAGIRTWKEIADLQHVFSPDGLQDELETRAVELCNMLNDTMNRMTQVSNDYHLAIDPIGCVAVQKRLNP